MRDKKGWSVTFSIVTAALILAFSIPAGAQGIIECHTEAYDLDDGIVPDGWYLLIKRMGHFSDGKLWGQPTDGGCWLGMTLDYENRLTELRFTWNGTLDAAYWGLFTGVDIHLENGDRYSILNTSVLYEGAKNTVRFKEPWDDGYQGSV